MPPDGVLRNHQFFSNLAVAQTVGDQFEYLHFTIDQIGRGIDLTAIGDDKGKT